jgi:hypothetical protein
MRALSSALSDWQRGGARIRLVPTVALGCMLGE